MIGKVTSEGDFVTSFSDVGKCSIGTTGSSDFVLDWSGMSCGECIRERRIGYDKMNIGDVDLCSLFVFDYEWVYRVIQG